MKIFLTGNLGYIGTVLTEDLKQEGYFVIGYDCGFYDDCLLSKCVNPDIQIKKDIRNISDKDLNGIDCIVHLAALSNDPLGELIPGITSEINFTATLNLAKKAKKNLVKKFIYVSSQSMYGISKSTEPLDEYNSVKSPISEYAKTKWNSEIELKKLIDDKFNITFLRPATVFGSSPRLRSDIVYNNLLGSAYTSRKIDIKSDGSPIRPVVHVKDLCGYIKATIIAPSDLVNGKCYNIGILNGNYTVKEMANKVKELLPSSEINFLRNSNKDDRTYKVSFNRVNKDLSKLYTPKWNLDNGGKDLINFYKTINFTSKMFIGTQTNRIKKIQELINNNTINKKLFFN